MSPRMIVPWESARDDHRQRKTSPIKKKTSMKPIKAVLALGTGLCLMIVGCSKNEQASNITELEKVFQAKAPATDATKPGEANPSGTTQGQGDQIQQTVSHAVSALKTNGYLEAFVALRTVQSAPNLTLDQYTAVMNARLAVEKELAAKAVAGDPAALRAVQAIQNAPGR